MVGPTTLVGTELSPPALLFKASAAVCADISFYLKALFIDLLLHANSRCLGFILWECRNHYLSPRSSIEQTLLGSMLAKSYQDRDADS
jgi:hypothetical protein